MRGRTLLALVVILAIGGIAFADIQIHREHSFEARAGATVVVEASFHELEVTARPGNTVDVVVDLKVQGSGGSAKNIANDLQPQFLDQGDRLIIRSTRKKSGWSGRSSPARGTVRVNVPPGMNLEIHISSGEASISGDFGNAELDFHASSGGLDFSGSIVRARAEVSSGSIRVVVDQPLEQFTAIASSGDILLEGGAHAAEVEISSGSIRLSGLLGGAELGSSSGDIAARWQSVAPGDRVAAHASSGSVRLEFPTATVFDGSVGVSSGRLHSDFPAIVRGSGKKLLFEGGPEAVRLEVRTSSGNVRLVTN
jgi:hypothetical protein